MGSCMRFLIASNMVFVFLFDNNSDGQETTLMDLIGEEDEQIDNIANVEDLRQRLATLNPVERMIIEERYYKGKTRKR